MMPILPIYFSAFCQMGMRIDGIASPPNGTVLTLNSAVIQFGQQSPNTTLVRLRLLSETPKALIRGSDNSRSRTTVAQSTISM